MRYFLFLIISGFFIFSSSSVFAWETPTTRFSLNQSENTTTLKYNGKNIYQWSHSIESKNLPPDSKCSPSMKSQMLCIGQELFRNISVISTPNPRFFLIKKMNYESADAFLFDLQTKKLYTTEIMSFYIDQITKIEIGKQGVYIQYTRSNGLGGLAFLRKGNKLGIGLSEDMDDGNNLRMLDFELMPNKIIKITYRYFGDNNKSDFDKFITVY